jgi:hypothetical protein
MMIRFVVFFAACVALGACQQGRADDAATPDAAVQGAAAAAEHGAPVVAVADAAATDTIVVNKTAYCGCCKKWVEHLQKAGYTVVVHDMEQAELDRVSAAAGVPASARSCHTAIVRGYSIEGHVPADLIAKLLAEKPGVRGLAVAGMPMGSPGMEGVMKQSYDVLAFDAAGKTSVYATR